MKTLLITLFAFILVMGLASAYDDLGYVRTSTSYDIYLGCSYNSSYCANTFSCNLTVYSPTSVIVNNKQMSNTFYPQYNYTIPASNLSKNGLYYGRQVCCDATVGCSNDYAFQFHVNPQGKDYSNDGTIYAIMFVLLLVLFGFSIFSFIRIPFNNPRDGDGHILNIDWKKYLKIGSFVLAYICWVGITYFAWNISYGILQFDEMANFFKMIFRISFIGMFLVLPFTFLFTLIKLVRDKITYDQLLRGLTVR